MPSIRCMTGSTRGRTVLQRGVGVPSLRGESKMSTLGERFPSCPEPLLTEVFAGPTHPSAGYILSGTSRLPAHRSTFSAVAAAAAAAASDADTRQKVYFKRCPKMKAHGDGCLPPRREHPRITASPETRNITCGSAGLNPDDRPRRKTTNQQK